MDIINYSHQQNNDKENQSKQRSKLTFLRHTGEKKVLTSATNYCFEIWMECYQYLFNYILIKLKLLFQIINLLD